jgi:hypothetical protein
MPPPPTPLKSCSLSCSCSNPFLSGKDDTEWLIDSLHCGSPGIRSHNFAARLELEHEHDNEHEHDDDYKDDDDRRHDAKQILTLGNAVLSRRALKGHPNLGAWCRVEEFTG